MKSTLSFSPSFLKNAKPTTTHKSNVKLHYSNCHLISHRFLLDCPPPFKIPPPSHAFCVPTPNSLKFEAQLDLTGLSFLKAALVLQEKELAVLWMSEESAHAVHENISWTLLDTYGLKYIAQNRFSVEKGAP